MGGEFGDAVEQLRIVAELKRIADGVTHSNELLHALAIQNAPVTLDLLQQAGLARRQFFAANKVIAATTTATVVDLQPGDGNVGFWRRLDVEPDQSRILSMIVSIDGTPELRNPSVVPGELIPTSQWLPFYARFQATFTNLDGVNTHEVNVVGERVFLEGKVWDQIHAVLRQGGFTVCGLED